MITIGDPDEPLAVVGTDDSRMWMDPIEVSEQVAGEDYAWLSLLGARLIVGAALLVATWGVIDLWPTLRAGLHR